MKSITKEEYQTLKTCSNLIHDLLYCSDEKFKEHQKYLIAEREKIKRKKKNNK